MSYSQLMKEAGLGSEKIEIEHVFIFSFNEKWEKTVQKAVNVLLDLTHEAVYSLRIVSYAASACLVLWGSSKLIHSIRQNKKE